MSNNKITQTISSINIKYPPESAGRLMIVNVPIAHPNNSISEIEKMLLIKVKEFASIDYIYIVENNKLIGVISIKDILRQPKDILVNKVMIKNLIVAHPYTDQERVAYLALKNNIKAIPIVDKDNNFLGIVPNDTILSIIYNEASEDLQYLAGVSPLKIVDKKLDCFMDLSLSKILRHRLPWLIIGLTGGLLTAWIIGLFEKTLTDNIILASFIPLIVYMGGAVLAQNQVFFIRDLAINPKLNFFKYFLKQLKVVSLIALIISLGAFLVGYLFLNNLLILKVLIIALFAAIISSLFTSLVVPYFFSKINNDPANASGPIATIIQDLLGVSLYFLIATALL